MPHWPGPAQSHRHVPVTPWQNEMATWRGLGATPPPQWPNCWNDVPNPGLCGKVTDCECHHGAPWVLVLFGKTTDNHLSSWGQHHHRSFCGSLPCGFFSADPTHRLAPSPAINLSLPLALVHSGKLLLARPALQTLSGKARRGKASHQSPSCTQRTNLPSTPAIFLCTEHYPHLHLHMQPCLFSFFCLIHTTTPPSHMPHSPPSQSSHSYRQSSYHSAQHGRGTHLRVALGPNPQDQRPGPFCNRAGWPWLRSI